MEGYKHPIPEGQLPLYLWLASKRQFQTWVGVGSGLPTDCKCEPSQLQLSFDHAPSYSHELFKSTLVSVKEYGYLHYMYVLQRNEMNEIGAEAASKDKGKEEKGIVFSRETGGWGSGNTIIHAISCWTEGGQGRELHPTPCPPPPGINFCFQRPSHKDSEYGIWRGTFAFDVLVFLPCCLLPSVLSTHIKKIYWQKKGSNSIPITLNTACTRTDKWEVTGTSMQPKLRFS